MDHEDSFTFQPSSIPSNGPSFLSFFFVGWQDLFFLGGGAHGLSVRTEPFTAKEIEEL